MLAQKLRSLKVELRTSNRNVFGNVHQMVDLAQESLDDIQEKNL